MDGPPSARPRGGAAQRGLRDPDPAARQGSIVRLAASRAPMALRARSIGCALP